MLSMPRLISATRLLPLLAIVLAACSPPGVAARATLTQTARTPFPTATSSPSATPIPSTATAIVPVTATLEPAPPPAPTLGVVVVATAAEPPAETPVPSRAPAVALPSPSTLTSPRAQPGRPPSGVAAIDAIVAQMTLEDKIGQLFMLGFSGADASAAVPLLADLKAGGIVLSTNVSTAGGALALTTALQRTAKSNGLQPLLISANHEGGDVQPIKGGMTVFGPQWTLGHEPLSNALADACARGTTMGQQLARVGINMDLAPDLDVLDNQANTVIGDRAFSADPQVVARLGTAFIDGLQGQGVLAVGKHFPGHGSSTEDSHQMLPVVMHDRAWMDAHELVPFEAAIETNVAAIMVGHLSFPLVDPVANRPSSLSPIFVSDILRTQLGFDGLIVTDDVGQMKAITAGYSPGSAAVQALVAGSDVVLTVGPLQNEREMIKAVTAAIPGTISEDRLDQSVRRVLIAKMQAGLLDGSPSSLTSGRPACR
jgi:beta-N-acetylhexosaminidase